MHIHDTSSHVALILVYIANLLLREHGHRPVNTLGMDCKRNFLLNIYFKEKHLLISGKTTNWHCNSRLN